MSRNDIETVKQCLNGHPEEYRQLVQRYQGTLLSFLSGRMGDRERAEEAAQETFVRAYFSLRKLKKPGSFHSWLLGIADRVSKEQHREQVKNRPIFSPPSELEEPASAPPPHDDALKAAIARLPESYREVILLRYYGGRSCSEVAEHLGFALGTVTKKLSKAYAMLRDSLKRDSSKRDSSKEVGTKQANMHNRSEVQS